MAGVQATTDDAIRRVQEFYSTDAVRESWPWRHWNAQPSVAREINRRVTGSPHVVLHDHLRGVLSGLGLPLPAGRAVSLGCGQGRQDRSLFRHGIVGQLTGYDLSPASVAAAGRWARASGIDCFDYHEGDLNTLDLEEGAFDLVVAEMSLHHTTELERLFDVIAHALKPGGLLLTDEYVGPTRFRWSEAQMRTVNGLLAMLPDEMARTWEGTLKPRIVHQPDSFFETVDPSEAIRSGEVVARLEERFDVVWRRPYGGAILHPLLHDIAFNFREGDLYGDAFLAAAISLENTMMATGDLASDFAVLIARPK